jgi:hypothetical protein
VGTPRLKMQVFKVKGPNTVSAEDREMVFFVCGCCQETLKGAKVPLHRCQGPFSCVDCSKDFWKGSVQSHNACISEAQKYQGALYKSAKPKRDPQAEWMGFVAAACDSSSKHKQFFSRLATFSNVPRKKDKFNNFARSSLMISDPRVLDEMFSFIEETRAAMQGAPDSGKDAAPPAPKHGAEGSADMGMPPKDPVSSSKRRRETTELPVEVELVMPDSSRPFRWKKAIKDVVMPVHTVSVAKLRRRVLKKAVSCGADADAATFDKKLAVLVAKGFLLSDGEAVTLVDPSS